jgi:hypothetical protein
MKKIIDLLVKYVREHFYGEITIKFENGVIVSVKETKSYGKELFN